MGLMLLLHDSNMVMFNTSQLDLEVREEKMLENAVQHYSMRACNGATRLSDEQVNEQ